MSSDTRSQPATAALSSLLAVLGPARDVVEGRVEEDAPPAWCSRRGWDGFLLALDDRALGRCEEQGLAASAAELPGAPADLLDMARAVRAATALPALAGEHPVEALRSVSARKREQLPALLAAVEGMARSASRIVDVGAGTGHFTRLASTRFAVEALGIDRDPARVAAAARAASTGLARYVAMDAVREPLALAPDDLAVGLHACGELGDRLVLAAADAGADLALVSCCYQKIAGPSRRPLSRAGAELVLAREALGLANLTSQPVGVETSLEAMLDARRTRLALASLLRERGVPLAPGEEMRGLNRRRAHRGLADLAAAALALRGLAPATQAEVREHEARALRRHAVARRLSLPRNMLARALEIALVLDRAAALEERGHHVVVATVWSRAQSPRNVGLFASRARERLPEPRVNP